MGRWGKPVNHKIYTDSSLLVLNAINNLNYNRIYKQAYDNLQMCIGEYKTLASDLIECEKSENLFESKLKLCDAQLSSFKSTYLIKTNNLEADLQLHKNQQLIEQNKINQFSADLNQCKAQHLDELTKSVQLKRDLESCKEQMLNQIKPSACGESEKLNQVNRDISLCEEKLLKETKKSDQLGLDLHKIKGDLEVFQRDYTSYQNKCENELKLLSIASNKTCQINATSFEQSYFGSSHFRQIPFIENSYLSDLDFIKIQLFLLMFLLIVVFSLFFQNRKVSKVLASLKSYIKERKGSVKSRKEELNREIDSLIQLNISLNYIDTKYQKEILDKIYKIKEISNSFAEEFLSLEKDSEKYEKKSDEKSVKAQNEIKDQTKNNPGNQGIDRANNLSSQLSNFKNLHSYQYNKEKK